MSRRSKLISHINTLHNIRSIITAMKNLALIETGKISKFLIEQKKIVTSIENIAMDFLAFYPKYLANIGYHDIRVCILIGSERGFCGEFNALILNTWQDYFTKQGLNNVPIIAIGSKLVTKAEENIKLVDQLEAPSTAEEIPGIVLTLIKKLENFYPTSWVIIYNEEENNIIQPRVFMPFDQIKNEFKVQHICAPLLNLSSKDFFTNLLDEYLFAVLYDIFYKSFLVENKQRSQHMDGALQWLDKSKEVLIQNLNISRQEEITESIEEIMLSVEMVLMKSS